MKTFLYIFLAVLLISGLTIIFSPKLSVAEVPAGSLMVGIFALIIIYALYGPLDERLGTKSREFKIDSVKKNFLRWRCLFAFLLFGLHGLGYLIYKNGGALLTFYLPEYNINKYNLNDYPYIYSFTLGILFLLVFISICGTRSNRDDGGKKE
jgi:hypothetical protein